MITTKGNFTCDVFISYSSKDQTVTNALCHYLEERRIRCWIAPRDIRPGKEYADVIDLAIHQARIFVLVFSKNSSNSHWVRKETNLAVSGGKIIIPFRIEDCELIGAMRTYLNDVHWIDAIPRPAQAFGDLTKAILANLGRQNNPEVEAQGVDGPMNSGDEPSGLGYEISSQMVIALLIWLVCFIVPFGLICMNISALYDWLVNLRGWLVFPVSFISLVWLNFILQCLIVWWKFRKRYSELSFSNPGWSLLLVAAGVGIVLCITRMIKLGGMDMTAAGGIIWLISLIVSLDVVSVIVNAYDSLKKHLYFMLISDFCLLCGHAATLVVHMIKPIF